MIPDSLGKKYQNFFQKTDAGKYFVTELERIVNQCHELAEKNAEQSRDQTQQARGVRLVMNHLNSVMTEVKAKK